MKFGFYIHIPYCIQRCHYCDFTTFEQNQIMPPEDYCNLLIQELENRYRIAPTKKLTSIYFGGGTPSLIPAKNIVSLIQAIEKKDFIIDDNTEITIEINPATINSQKLNQYLDIGINRFSVGAQTFNDDLLKLCGREHTASDTHKTLNLLSQRNLNYSFDLLFALPSQTLDQLDKDLNIITDYAPQHLSPYCLTLKDNHPMNTNRPSGDMQIEMFSHIESQLNSINLEKYEISNFSSPGFESKHNLLYWRDKDYLGLGLSAHSYIKNLSPHGSRFWNPTSFKDYTQLVKSESSMNIKTNNFQKLTKEKLYEDLSLNEYITDYFHIHLRTKQGVNKKTLHLKFGDNLFQIFQPILNDLANKGLIHQSDSRWSLSQKGFLLSNKVFERLSFSSYDISKLTN